MNDDHMIVVSELPIQRHPHILNTGSIILNPRLMQDHGTNKKARGHPKKPHIPHLKHIRGRPVLRVSFVVFSREVIAYIAEKDK